MNDETIVEDEVEVPTNDGAADAVLYRWTDGRRPGVVNLPDGIGTRPSQRQMARRVAAEGYNVLLPNIYYRSGRAPFFPPKADFSDPRIMARFGELTAPVSADAMERDGSAYVDFLASRPEVSESPMGVVGFCFTGMFALRTAAARPDRIGAAASFHGGGLFKDSPASPHLVLPRVTASLYFGHARDDRSMPAEAIANFENALAQWGGTYESETYDARHGWTVPDSGAYNEPEAERAFAKLRALFAASLH
ncbi:MAG TPA: dienelactone hydrolase family protein [Thermoanaerobaculia bacterium]